MKKLHLILLSLLTVSLITHCPASSSGNPTNGTQLPAPTDITTLKTIHAHVNNDAANGATVVALAAFITVAEPTYSILEGNDDDIFNIDSSTGLITVADESQITYDATTKTNNIHLLRVRVRNGSDSSKAMEAPLRIVVRGFGGAFITTWTTTEMNETITIPTIGRDYDFTVNWGESPPDITTYMGTDPTATHTYATAGTYTVMITGDFPRIYFNNAPADDVNGDNKTKILTVEQWGSTTWSSMEGAFDGAENLTVPAVDAPDLTLVTNMGFMFASASAFNQNINHWDISNIVDMRSIFQGASTFNQDINHWDTRSIQNMSAMFSGASAFNQDISKWNTGMVNDMSFMFSFTNAFNQDISKWNTAMVTKMSFMFTSASAFNQDISKWNTAMVTNMSGMFASASAFNQNISTSGNSWNTAMVADMSQMFQGATAFNQDISGWNVSEVDTETECTDFATDSGLTDSNRPRFDSSFTACNP